MSPARLFGLLFVLFTPPAAVVSTIAFWSNNATAKSGYESLYTYEQTWNTAVRLIRVDLGAKLLEKDEKAGYLLFEYEYKGALSSGSIELLKSEAAVRVICQIPKMPSYHEAAVLDRLARKLKDDHGTPPERSKPVPPPATDAGPDEGETKP